jgi:hypothetical protein
MIVGKLISYFEQWIGHLDRKSTNK